MWTLAPAMRSDQAVHQALRQELNTLAALTEQVDELVGRIEAVEKLGRRLDRIERKLSPRPSAGQVSEIRRLFAMGVSTRGIATLLGISRDTAIRCTRELPRPSYSNGLDGKRRARPRAVGASDFVS
jgi:hypothetical protein